MTLSIETLKNARDCIIYHMEEEPRFAWMYRDSLKEIEEAIKYHSGPNQLPTDWI